MKYHTFSTQFASIANQIFSDIFVSDTILNISNDELDTQKAVKCKGLWDTGAMYSVISDRIVKQLNLPIISKTPIIGISGTIVTTTHIIDLWLPDNIVFRKVRVAKSKFPKDFDFLIGMDIITRGDFYISNYDGKTLFSFRYPSVAPVDF